MRGNRSCTSSISLSSIDHVPVTPLDPIAFRAAVARSEGQGRRPVFRRTDTSCDDARPENIGRRRSPALDRSEHDGRLMGNRDGGLHAVLPAIIAMAIGTMIGTAFPFAATAGERDIDRPNERALVVSSTRARPTASLSAADPWADHIAEAGRRFAIPERWIRAVMAVESAGDERALSSAGAMGLMQIMPATWEELRAKHDLGNDPYDVRSNILAGAAYLRTMHDRYGNVAPMLAAYNAGPGRYERHLAGEPLPAETVEYVARVMSMIDSGSGIPLSIRREPDGSKNAIAPIFAGRSIDRHPDAETTADLAADRGNITVRSAFSPLSDGLFVKHPEP